MLLLQWKDHGPFMDPEVAAVMDEASTVVVGTLELQTKEATQFSTGDAQIPTTWSLRVQFVPNQVIVGQLPAPFLIEGRSRPNHPDPKTEDRFWAAWEADPDMAVVVFLGEDDQVILHMEPLASPRLATLEQALKDGE